MIAEGARRVAHWSAMKYAIIGSGRQGTAAAWDLATNSFIDLHSFLLHTMDHGVVALSGCRISTVPHEALRRITERLPHLGGRVRHAEHLGREVANRNGIPGAEGGAQGGKVKPSNRRVRPQERVVQVEPVDVDGDAPKAAHGPHGKGKPDGRNRRVCNESLAAPMRRVKFRMVLPEVGDLGLHAVAGLEYRALKG